MQAEADTTPTPNKEKAKAIRAQTKAGLVLPVARLRSLIKKRTSLRTSAKTSVYITSVLETLTRTLFKDLNSYVQASLEKKTKQAGFRISPRQLRNAISNNSGLFNILLSNKGVFAGAGVDPFATQEIDREIQLRKQIKGMREKAKQSRTKK
jgi:histone H3/H4